MAADPQVYTDEAQPGKMRHTFTGIRQQFPNRGIHYVILEAYSPFRRELLVRPEFQQEGRWETNLVTLCQQGLTNISNAIKNVTDRNSAEDAGKTLEVRTTEKQNWITKANSKDTTLEALAGEASASHADEITLPADQRIAGIHFDFTGEDPDYAQPTPGRVPNGAARSLIIELDRLVVQMSQSNSADHPRTINSYDAAVFQGMLADMYNIVTQAGSEQNPYLPTGLRRSQLDNSWNADGSFDPELSDGAGRQGDVVSQTGSQS